MKNSFYLLPFLILSVFCAQAQDNLPTDAIPNGYAKFEHYSGDLNKDGLQDYVFIIKKVDTAHLVVNRFGETVDRNRRGILVFFQQPSGQYQLVSQNLDCFSSENEEGGAYFPPELWVAIDNNKLYIQYGHGKYGYWVYTFRYQNANFELIGYDASSNHGPRINKTTSINFLTKKKLVKLNTNEGDEVDEPVFKETWSRVEVGSLIKLKDIQDFDALAIDIH